MKVFPYGTNVVFSFRYSLELKEKVKHLFEGQMFFNKFKKHPNCWSVPMSVVSFPAESINKLINFCNAEGFIIHPDLIGQLKDNAENQKNLHSLSSATEIEGDLKIEGLLLEPRPYQKAGIKYMVSAKKCINADSVRLGKSMQSLAAIHYLQAYPTLVVCKSGLMYNWKNEIEKTLGEQSVHITDSVKKGIAENKNFVIINPEKLAKLQDQLKEYKFGSVIYDEAHNIGGSKTAKFNALKEITKDVPYRYALTGTPIKNRALEVVNILDFLGRLKEFGGKWRLINEFYEVRQDFSIGEARDLDKLHAKLKSFCMVRRTAKEVLGEVPDKVYSSVLVELSNYKEYRSLSSEIQKLKGVAFVSERKGKLFELKRIVGEGKVDAISQWIEDFLDSGEQLVVFAHHIEVQKRLLTKFPDAAYILGGQSLASREQNKNAFQNKEKQLIICSLMAAGEGLDLSSANTVAICELGWTPPQMEQAIGRIYRVGKTEPMSIYTFIAENTIDIKLASMLQDKGFEGDMTVSGKVEDSYVESLLEELQD
jgi:SNF2 family DNA or RNA helicase